MPGFVYGIVIVQFALFLSFALNQWLPYRGIGKWTDYIYGKRPPSFLASPRSLSSPGRSTPPASTADPPPHSPFTLIPRWDGPSERSRKL